MKPLVVVPTYNRVDQLGDALSTSAQLEQAGVRHYLLVQAQEADRYFEALASYQSKLCGVLELPAHMNDCGIARTREWLRIYFLDSPYAGLIMLDDDVHFLTHAGAAIKWLGDISEVLNGVHFLANSGIYGDENFGSANVIPTGRCMQAVSMNRDTAAALSYEEPLVEDFVAAIQSHQKGWLNVGCLVHQIQSAPFNPGGLQSDGDDVEKWQRANDYLVEHYPDFVTIYDSWGSKERRKAFCDWWAVLRSNSTDASIFKRLKIAELLTVKSLIDSTAMFDFDGGSERTLEAFNLRYLEV